MKHIMRAALRAGSALAAPLVIHGLAVPAVAAPACLDVALVMAVDSSASVSEDEFNLQKRGIASAFRSPQVQNAIAQAGRVAVSAVFFGSEGLPKPQTGWVVIDGKEGADAFAREIEAMPRQVTGDTGLGAGLTSALARLSAANVCAARKIINVSGDGEETRAVRGARRSAAPPQVRDLAESQQVEINALAISNEEPDLAQYYAANVITGPDAFVMEVRDYGGFAAALQRKLIREIGPRMVSALAAAPGFRAR